MSMNRVLFSDMKGLRKLGLNGMISCQNQRVWFPSGFGMVAMAQALWDNEADYDRTADAYFTAAFGPDGLQVRAYLEELSRLLVPPYFRSETERVDPEIAESFAKAAAHIEGFSPVIARNLAAGLPAEQRRSWEYLDYHARMCALLAPAAQKRAEGDEDQAKALFGTFRAYVEETEPDIADALDVFELTHTLAKIFKV